LSGSTSVQNFTSVNATGRYVMVRINGTGTLSLAEVQVFGEAFQEPPTTPNGDNLALNQPATQSTTGYIEW